MTIPSKIRYRRYEDWTEAEKQALIRQKRQSPWLAHYHIEPQTGLLNDPNGFSYFDGKYHLFYQNWPFGPAHGLKSWVHTESPDLVHFTETGAVVYPDTPLDSHGAYSGSAYAVKDKLFLFYTGNVRDDHWQRHPLQIGAYMDKEHQITKLNKILIDQPDDVTDHFRDPQIFEYKGDFYAIIGAQNLDKQGFIKLYKAKNRHVEDWDLVGDLDFAGTGSEYMIECPNLVFIDDQPVLLYSPQGLDKAELAYENIYPNTYKICQAFDAEKAQLINPSPIYNLDEGFECYATQAFNTPDGRALAVSWIGLPDVSYPTDAYSYQGAMSLVKELTIKDGKLYQTPVAAMKKLRHNQTAFTNLDKTTNCYELELIVPENQAIDLLLFADRDKKGLKISLNTQTGQLVLDRSQTDFPFATDYGQTRTCQLPLGECKLRIFIDTSIFEIFVNDGEKVLTGRYFPTTDQTGIQLLSGQVTGHYYDLGN